MSCTKVLITAPLRQDIKVLAEYLKGLDALKIPSGVIVDRFFVINDCAEAIPYLKDNEYETFNTHDSYVKTHNDHIWTQDNLNKMSGLRNKTIQRALDGAYDYWFSVDTDLVLHPNTLQALLQADKDIISEVFWTHSPNGNLWCNSWMFDQCDPDGQYETWMLGGLYRVGMTGACTLVKTDVFRHGVDYSPIPNIRNALRGEDRWFGIRAACAGVEMWMDTHYPATHLYTDAVYKQYMAKGGFPYGTT